MDYCNWNGILLATIVTADCVLYGGRTDQCTSDSEVVNQLMRYPYSSACSESHSSDFIFIRST